MAVLISIYHHGIGTDTQLVDSYAECNAIVSAWKNQPELEISAILPNVRFQGRCVEVQVP